VADREDLSAEYREFTREMVLRFERAMRALVTEMRSEFRAHREESRAYFEELRAGQEREARRVDDLIEENRAQRQALLRILDRLGNGPATAT